MPVFPNPTTGAFKILGQNLDTSYIEVYNALGQTVSYSIVQQNASELQIDLATQQAGLYFIRIWLNSEETLTKFILESR